MAALALLYSYRRCPYAMRARMALSYAGIAYQLHDISLKDKPAGLLAVSPKGTVPVLVLPTGEVLEQSLDIMCWAFAQTGDIEGWWARAQTPDILHLWAVCDGDFKHHLDRYKYPGRYAGANALAHRSSAAAWLAGLEQQLQTTGWLFGPAPSLADMAIAPFVRQFAQTDPDWFAAQDWPKLRFWLNAIVSSALFDSVMHKYPPWQRGTESVIFAPDRANLKG